MRAALLALLLVPLAGRAEETTLAESQRAQVEALRGELANELQLQAYDLVDELVYGWTQQPVFATDTPVVLADVSVPVGFGSGLQALVENHFASLLLKNARTRVILSHCPQCTSLVVHSGAKGTVISRGVDAPEAMASAGKLSGSSHALFLDFEVEGSSLVLRARITALEPALPIVYARTLTTSTSSPALLRSGEHLKSAAEARKEYLDALEGRGITVVPIRATVRSYAAGGATVSVAPFIWLQGGVEVALNDARAWTASLSAGASWMPQLHTAFLGQARISRLLSGSSRSLTNPDLYGFMGLTVISISGLSALAFADQIPNLETLAVIALGADPHITFGAFQLGLELRVKNRIGVGVFLESMPALGNAQAIGNYLDLGLVRFQALGAEVSFCF